jgi:hypothetical protein
MQSHLGSVVWCLDSIARLGPKFFGTFMRLVVKVYNLYTRHVIIELEDGLKL